jgi:hypothetical protein
MSDSLIEALDRTLLLMRDNLVPEVDDSRLIAALTGTEAALVGDARNLSSHAAQCAYITSALLMARSGHRVHLAAPDVPLLGAQPPLTGNRLISALMEIGDDLLPGIAFSSGAPPRQMDLLVAFGDSAPRFPARHALRVNATAWSALLGSKLTAARWIENEWPCGALGVGALVATEAFKAAMHVLRPFANNVWLFDALFAFSDDLSVDLAPPDAPKEGSLGGFDFISGGAITNAALFALVRLPGLSGSGRVIEPDRADGSNLNRYLLLLRSAVGQKKAELLRILMGPHLEIQAITSAYKGGTMSGVGKFLPSVLVGVDDIPVRWKVQEQDPHWLGIGATTHWAAMASFHQRGMACARCLHPRDDQGNGRIPTAAFVSFFAGLMLACYFVRAIGNEAVSPAEQYAYLSPLRLERLRRSPVARRPDCPTCNRAEGHPAP